MVQYKIEEKILITKDYIHTRTYMETQNTFRIQFTAQSVPSTFAIQTAIKNVLFTGHNYIKIREIQDPQELKKMLLWFKTCSSSNTTLES